MSQVDNSLRTGSQVLQSTAKEIKNIAEPDKLKGHFNNAKAAVSANTSKAADFVRSHGLTGTAKFLVNYVIDTTRKGKDCHVPRRCVLIKLGATGRQPY